MKKAVIWILLLFASIAMMYWIAQMIGLPWQLTESLLLMIGVHELGHLGMAKYFGYPTAGFYFIPGLGGAAILKEIPKIRHHSFLIWYAGPAAGFTETLLLAAINYFWWHSPLVWQIVFVWSAINIINLLPIIPLDGGMILWSLAGGRDESYLSSFYFFAHMFMSAVVLGLVANPIFAFIVLVFGFSTRKHLIDLWQAGGDRTPMTGRQKLFATMQAVILTFNLLALSVFSGLMIKT